MSRQRVVLFFQVLPQQPFQTGGAPVDQLAVEREEERTEESQDEEDNEGRDGQLGLSGGEAVNGQDGHGETEGGTSVERQTEEALDETEFVEESVGDYSLEDGGQEGLVRGVDGGGLERRGVQKEGTRLHHQSLGVVIVAQEHNILLSARETKSHLYLFRVCSMESLDEMTCWSLSRMRASCTGFSLRCYSTSWYLW